VLLQIEEHVVDGKPKKLLVGGPGVLLSPNAPHILMAI
jgi:hypothetical protein